MCAAAATTRSIPARTRPTEPFSALPHPLPPYGKESAFAIRFPTPQCGRKKRAAQSNRSFRRIGAPSGFSVGNANSAPRRTAPLSESLRQANNQRQDERFIPFSICAKPSPRRRRNALPGRAFASHGFTIFHEKPMRAARREEPYRSPNLCDNQRQDELQPVLNMRKTIAPPQKKCSPGRGVCIVWFYSFASVSST